jgi:hypothetical protein
MIRHKERLAHGLMGDEGWRTGHEAPPHRALPLVQGHPRPQGNHRPIDVRPLAWLVRHEGRQEGLSGMDAFELPQKLPEGGAVRPLANPRQQRMRTRIAGRQRLNPPQRRTKERVEATTERLRAVMQQGKVVVGMLEVVALQRLLQRGHDHAHALVLLQPRCEDVDANKRQRRCDTDELPQWLSFFFDRRRAVDALSHD